MTLLNPAFLWALAALLPLAAVYWLKVRPRRKPTTAIFLWKRVVSERKATTLFQRLRDLLSLLLMLLAVTALVFAMAQPQIVGDERRDLLLVIDRSASMAARDGGSSRLQRARDEARAVVRSLNGQQRAAIASVADNVVYHTHFTRDPRRLHEAINTVAQSVMPIRGEPLADLSGRAEWAEDYRVIVISDGVLGGAAVPEDVELVKIGGQVENAGIVGADLQRLPDGAGRLGLWIQLASTFDRPFETDLLVQRNGVLQRVLPVEVAPGLNDPMVFELEGDAGAWQVQLDIDDALSLDDTAYLALAERQPVRVAVTAQDRYFFQHSVLAFARSDGLLELVESEPDVVLSQGRIADGPLCVVFEPQGSSPLWPELGERLGPVVPRARVEDHPALRFLDVEQMTFAGARQVQAPAGAVVLVESVEGVPLIWQVRGTDQSVLVVNLNPREADLFFSAHFPVLVHGAVTHLSRRTEPLRASYQPGQSVPIPGGDEGVETTVSGPGWDEPRTLGGGRFGPLDALGFFEMASPAGRWLAAGTLAADQETLLNAVDVEHRVEPLSRGWPISSLLLLLAIVVLVTESLMYHRRKVG